MATSYGQFTLSKVEDGKSVTVLSTKYEYKLSTSGTTPPTGTWEKNPVAPTTSQYAWTKTTVTFSDGSKSITYTVGGKTGTNGTSVTVSGTEYAYQKSTSGTTVPTGTWLPDPVEPTQTEYVWTRTIVTFSNGSKATTYTVGGKTGQTGPQGKGISSIVTQYYLSTSNAKQEGGSWNTTPAAYVNGRYYWRRDHITWSDSTTSDTTAVLDNALTTANKNAYDAQYAVDNMEIGGRNLLLGSKDYTKFYYSMNGGTVVKSAYEDGAKFKITALPASGSWGVLGFNDGRVKNLIEPSQEYTVSFDLMANIALSGVDVQFNAREGNGTNPMMNQGSVAFSLTKDTWHHVVITTTAMSTLPQISNQHIYFAIPKLKEQLCTFYVRNLKFEKGNVATDWSPAPEDLEASIESVNERSVEYIVGTQTAATGSWKGVTTDSTLKTGKTIAYKLPYAGSGNASLTLTLAGGTTTAAIPVYLSNTRVTTQFPVQSVIQMTYDGSNWRVTAIPDSNYYDRTRVNNAFTAVSAITANRLICGTDSGYQHIAAGVSFDIGHPILYAVSAIAANATGTNNYLAYPSVNASTSGTIESGAAKKTLYLKGTVSASTFTVASSPFMTTVIPTTENGFFYISLGVMYSTTQIYFESSNRLYAYVNGSFQAVDVAGQILAIQSINRLNSLEPIVEQHSANFDVLEDSIMSNVEANYTRADEFNTYVDNQQSSLTQLSNSITAQFNESRELIGSVNGALETYKDDISKYIRFSAEGIEIGEKGNALTLKIDNDEIGFYKEGDQIAYWDGSTLYTGNAWITLERQFRIGNFAAIPRSDGSVSWLKVGE